MVPNDFELRPSDITSFSVEVTSNGYYFTIGCSTAPYSFSISAASKSEEDNDRLLELIEKVSVIIETQNQKNLDKKVKVSAFRNMRWFWAMIILSVIVFVVVMGLQLLKG